MMDCLRVDSCFKARSENERYLETFQAGDEPPRLSDEEESEGRGVDEVFRPLNPDSESGESTDSGEYTIRDGSLPSGGSYEGFEQEELASQRSQPIRPGRGRVVSASAVGLTVSMLASRAEGSALVAYRRVVGFPQRMIWEGDLMMFVLGALCVFATGLAVALCMFRCKVEVAVRRTEPHANPPSAATMEVPPSIRTPTLRQRRQRRGVTVFLTPHGGCVHSSRDCQTLRDSTQVLTRYMCTVCGQHDGR